MRTNEIFTLFQNIAEAHTSIQHTAANQHYARIYINTDEFGSDDIEELMASKQNQLKYPCLVVGVFAHTYNESNNDKPLKKRPVSFWIMDKVTEGLQYDDRENVISSCEQIGENCLAYLERYAKQNIGRKFFEFNDIAGEPIPRAIDKNIYGFRFDITFISSAAAALFYGQGFGEDPAPVLTDPITITNSDGSFTRDIQTDTVLADINFTDTDGSQSQVPAAKDIIATPAPLEYMYPFFSEVTSYRDGDEAWQVQNVWNEIYQREGNRTVLITQLEDFYTLKTKNIFGNYSRFTSNTGEPQTDETLFLTGAEIYDNYLGIIVRAANNGLPYSNLAGGWNEAIDLAQTEYDGSYFLPPKLLIELIQDEETYHYNGYNAVMDFPGSDSPWIATTDDLANINAFRWSAGRINASNKTNTGSGINIVYKPLLVTE
jgi:hypothetical protein